jgi:transmembrane sensor
MDKYANYSLADFLADTHFRQWVKFPTTESNQFWENVQVQFPQHKEAIAQARLLVLAYQIEEQTLSEEIITQAWQAQKRKQLAVSVRSHQPKAAIIRRVQLYRVAASLTVLMLVGVAIWYNYFRFEPLIYQTNYGQIQIITLPDGSKVTLNANSRLEIKADWGTEASRDVSLTGEAFFEVEKKPATKQKFVVHTPDLDIVVLGTRFNVNNRNINTKVVLAEGSVKLAVKNDDDTTKDLLMRVGDLVEFSKKAKTLIKRNVNTAIYSSWKDNKLIFDNTPLSEIAILIKENYGLIVRFQDAQMGKRKISGTIPSENLKILLTSLETIFNIKITQEEQYLIFEK